MSDYEDKVLPVAPVVGKKVIKVNSFAIEPKQNQPFTRKKTANNEKKTGKRLSVLLLRKKLTAKYSRWLLSADRRQ